jgi:hypothetical protein
LPSVSLPQAESTGCVGALVHAEVGVEIEVVDLYPGEVALATGLELGADGLANAGDARPTQRRLGPQVQPGLVGLIDGTLSTHAPIFAAALLAESHAALLVGLATALGAGISMGLSEALSDDWRQPGADPRAGGP